MRGTPIQFGFRSESRRLDAKARAEIGGDYVALPDGVVHYELGGCQEGEVVVLVHGFSVPLYTWDATFAALTRAGFRVLRYDLYGRGTSDRPAVRYDQALFDRQLLCLLDALGLRQPVNLVGVSLGGLISVVFASRHPQRVRRLCLIDPLCAPIRWTFPHNLMLIPGVGELLMALFGDALLADQAQDFLHPERFSEYFSRFYPQLQYRGFKRAILSTMRHMAREPMEEAYRRAGSLPIPTLLLWGKEDRVIPYAESERLLAYMPRIQRVAVADCGHLPHIEKPEVVHPLLINFLRQ